jgi:hypothetical protein
VRVATDADLAEQIGHLRFFDLVDHDKVRTGGWKTNAKVWKARETVKWPRQGGQLVQEGRQKGGRGGVGTN